MSRNAATACACCEAFVPALRADARTAVHQPAGSLGTHGLRALVDREAPDPPRRGG